MTYLHTPHNEAYQKLQELGWQLKSIKQKNGLWVASGTGPGDKGGERIGQSPEMALAALVLYAQRANSIRQHAAMEHAAAWTHDFSQHKDAIARAYSKAPAFEAKAVPAWRALAEESRRQADAIRKQIQVEVTDKPEPYMSHHEMRQDVHHKKRYQVTRANSDHPVWTPDDVMNFRLVHDVVGHAQGAAGHDWDGEHTAFSHHAPWVSPLAREALFVETLGRRAYEDSFHGHGPKKVALMSDILNEGHAKEGDHVTIPHGATPDADAVVKEVMNQLPPGGYIEPTRQARDTFMQQRMAGASVEKAHAVAVAYLGMSEVPSGEANRIADGILMDFLADATSRKTASWAKVGDWIKEAADPGKTYQTLMKRPDIINSELAQTFLRSMMESHSGQKVMGNLRFVEWGLSRIKRIIKGGGELPPIGALVDNMVLIFNELEEAKNANMAAPDIFKADFQEATRWAEEQQDQRYEDENRWRDKQTVYRYKGANKGWTIDRVTDPADFRTEGSLMGHCVGGQKYVERKNYGQTDVFSLRDPRGLPHATIELLKKRFDNDASGFAQNGGGYPGGTGTEEYEATDPEGDQYNVLQAFGKSDKPPQEKYRTMIGEWFQAAGITSESNRKTEQNWADDTGQDGSYQCSGGYGAHEGYNRWEDMEAPPPDQVRNLQELFELEETLEHYHGMHPFEDFKEECPYQEYDEGPGAGYFDLKHREDYGLKDDYKGFDGPTCEGMEVEGLKFPEIDWESLLDDIADQPNVDVGKIGKAVAMAFERNAELQKVKSSYYNSGATIQEQMDAMYGEINAFEQSYGGWMEGGDPWQPEAQEHVGSADPHTDRAIQRLRAIWDATVLSLPELKAQAEKQRAENIESHAEHPDWEWTKPADQLYDPSKEKYEGYPLLGGKVDASDMPPDPNQGQLFNDMQIPHTEEQPNQARDERMLNEAAEMAEQIAPALLQEWRDNKGKGGDHRNWSHTLGHRLRGAFFKKWNVDLGEYLNYGSGGGLTNRAVDAATQWLQQQTDPADMHQHAIQGWQQAMSHEPEWMYYHNPAGERGSSYMSAALNQMYPHMDNHQDIIKNIMQQYASPPGFEIPPHIQQWVTDSNSWPQPEGFQKKIPNPFYHEAKTAATDPAYRFVYFNTGLNIEPWHHNLRYQDMRRTLLKDFNMPETHAFDDDHNEWASGDVYDNEDGSFTIDLDSLAAKEIQLEAINAVHAWLVDRDEE